MKIAIVNGPNLNLLGLREPEVYGTATLADLEARLRAFCKGLNIEPVFFQSNSEGGIIDFLHDCKLKLGVDAIVINPGAYTHYSYAIRDAISGISIPTAEIHISDIDAREEFRKTSVIREVCAFCVKGQGFAGYETCIERLFEDWKKKA